MINVSNLLTSLSVSIMIISVLIFIFSLVYFLDSDNKNVIRLCAGAIIYTSLVIVLTALTIILH